MGQYSERCLISAVIPVYNDKNSLQDAIMVSLQCLEEITPEYEVIVAEDASIDGTYELACEWALRYSRIRVLHRDKRLGRGSALSAAAREASGEIFCYFDVDLATDMKHLSSLIQSVQDGNDIATGSRFHKDSIVIRSFNREVKSRAFNFLVRLLFRDNIFDHKCGFKAFKRERLLSLLPIIQDTHWFWDTEVLVYAKRCGYRVTEIPVTWKEGAGTTVRRSDILSLFRSILKLRFWLFREYFKKTESHSVEISGQGVDITVSDSRIIH